MQKNKYDYLLAPKYDDMIRGINITPDQTKELKKLYNRATLPVRPWAFVFAGVMCVDFVGAVYAICNYAKTGDKRIAVGYLAFLLAQFIAAVAWGNRMQNAQKQLQNKINEIRNQQWR